MKTIKRTRINFSNHILETNTAYYLSTYHLKKANNSVTNNIKFIITNGVTIVTGDFGNFMFCREFIPSKDEFVDDSYWLGKFEMHSEQIGKEYSEEETIKELEYQIESGLEEYGYENNKLIDAKLYYEDLLNYTDNSNDYLTYIDKTIPSFLERENIPYVKTIKYNLLIVFDAFDEICKRLEIEEL